MSDLPTELAEHVAYTHCPECGADVDENCDGNFASCPRFDHPTLANEEDHDDGDDFEDQGAEGEELELDDGEEFPFDAEDPEDNEGEDCPDDLTLED